MVRAFPLAKKIASWLKHIVARWFRSTWFLWVRGCAYRRRTSIDRSHRTTIYAHLHRGRADTFPNVHDQCPRNQVATLFVLGLFAVGHGTSCMIARWKRTVALRRFSGDAYRTVADQPNSEDRTEQASFAHRVQLQSASASSWPKVRHRPASSNHAVLALVKRPRTR